LTRFPWKQAIDGYGKGTNRYRRLRRSGRSTLHLLATRGN
jgi:hypothetical protein